MNREVFIELPKPVSYAGYPPELQTSSPASEPDRRTNDDILNKIKELYGENRLDAFSQWYRVGKYEKTKSEGVVGTGNIVGSNAFNQIERVEAFLDTFASGRYQFHFTDGREKPSLNWNKAKLWAEYRLKKQYKNNLLIEKIEQEVKIKEKCSY
ncbi:hypothetical protein HZA75_05720 [Candidatus Roizmanbacteria bacterium]|nr:hypothetical protein [Candidatus Roizmanbacteria bacterium]